MDSGSEMGDLSLSAASVFIYMLRLIALTQGRLKISRENFFRFFNASRDNRMRELVPP